MSNYIHSHDEGYLQRKMINIIRFFNPMLCTLDLTFNTDKRLTCIICGSCLTGRNQSNSL